ncbi:MAG: alpha/beta hydrolase [Acidobacteriota bacterium]
MTRGRLSPGVRVAVRVAAWALAATMLVSAWLAVAPATSYRHFQARVVASEGSAWVALAGVLLVVGTRATRLGTGIAAIGLLSAATASVPLARALPVAASVPAQFDRVFGPPGPLPAAGGVPRSAPLVLVDLWRGLDLPDVTPTTFAYREVDGAELAMDVLRPSGSGPWPGIVVVHGGSWSGGARTEFSGLSRYLVDRGFIVASMDYRLAPRWSYPAAAEDVMTAIEALKENARDIGLDATRLVLLGRSAGGQLALLAAYTANDPAIRGVVSFYAPSDLVYGYEHPADPRVFDSTRVLTTYIGGHLIAKRDQYRAASPVAYVDQSTPPTLLIHGTPDELVDKEQSRRLDRRLADAGVPHLLVELPWASHGCDYFLRGPCGQISTYAVERFLRSVLRAHTAFTPSHQ